MRETMPAPEMTPLGRAALDSGVSPEDLDAYLAACKRPSVPAYLLESLKHDRSMWAQAPVG